MRCKDQPCSQVPRHGETRCYFHGKKHAGLLESVDEYLSDVEIDSMMAGRLHQDGRRLDHYIVDDDQP